jgi:AraC-like DNA-binding protein
MLYTLSILFYFINIIFPQIEDQSDNLFSKSYSELKEGYFENYSDSDIAVQYANAYLSKGKLEKDNEKIARGFDFLARQHDIEINLKYCDSIIAYSKDLKHNNYPAAGYLLKGFWLYNKGDYQEALQNYLVGNDLALLNNNKSQLIASKQAIGALKNRWGDYKEALVIYKELLNVIEAEPDLKSKFIEDHLIALYDVSLAFQRNNRFDSAQVYIDKGYHLSKEYNDSVLAKDFVFAFAVNKFYKNQFKEARDSLVKIESRTEGVSLSINLYYQGLIALQYNNIEQSIIKFKAIDSLYGESQDEFPELRNVYENLVDIYESQDNKEFELIYVKKLLIIDSLLDSNREHINKEIIVRYDTPSLKRKIIRINESLQSQKSKRKYDALIFVLIFLFVFILLIFQYKKKSEYKKNLEKLLTKSSSEKKQFFSISKTENLEVLELGIKDEIVKQIIVNLENFENKHLFKQTKITASNLAKQLGTNSTYLSKVVNFTKKKSFAHYINDLRIDYLIKELKSNSILSNYTIEALGKEIGFGNTDSFTKAFKKRTGIPIGYFLKNITY